MNETTGFLHTAIRAAQAAAQIHQRYVGGELGIDTKTTHTDLVTRVDKESEARIREVLLSSYPDHVVLGEEEGQDGEAPYRWIVDPLDGTLNYAHGFPFYCVSIALEIEGRLEVGVVLDSFNNELFTATRGGGALRNGAPIGVTRERDLSKSMLATGFAYNPTTALDNAALFARMLGRCRALRRPGAAALDLAYVACGRLDGFWELNLNAWDVAAGILLVREAGGHISGGAGGPYAFGKGVLVATNGQIHGPLIDALELPDALL
jgi:myo-inositol-1(or 4)-monophosphatase